MVLEFHRPAPPLDKYIELMTYYAARSEIHTIERLVPDGSVNLIIDLTDTPKFIFDNESLLPKQKCERAWISGMHARYISISAAKDACMLVVRFLPGGSFPFIRIPLFELNNIVVDANLIFGNAIVLLREQLLYAAEPKTKFAITEAWLAKIAQQCHAAESIVAFAVRELTNLTSPLSLTNIASKSGYSHKHFISIFKTHLGQSPKMFQRISRFNKVLEEIERNKAIHWTKLCYELGYHDQAHFIKEFREFAGINPNRFLQERGEYIHYLPVA